MSVDFNPFTDLNIRATSPIYRTLRDRAPVHWSPEGQIFTVSRYDDVSAVLKDSKTFSSEAMQTVLIAAFLQPFTPRYAWKLFTFALRARLSPFAYMKVKNLISLDGQRHTDLRKIVGRGFTPRRISSWSARVAEIVEENVAKIRKQSEFDVVEDLAVPLPSTIIAEMLGIAPERQDDFKRWSTSIIDVASGAAKNDLVGSGVLDDLTDLFVYLQDVIRTRRENPRDDLISVLVDPKQSSVLGAFDVIQFTILLLVAGNETTTNLIGNAVCALLDNPRQLDRVLDDPGMIPGLVEETLRFDPPLTVAFRNTTRDTVLSGTTIPKGSQLAVLISSANRDERQFENPDQFRVDRDTTGQLGFGLGVHFCLGSALARLQAQTALGALVPELANVRHEQPDCELIDSFLVRGRRKIRLTRRLV